MKPNKITKKLNFNIDEITLVLIVAVMAIIIVFYEQGGVGTVEAEKITALILDDHDVSFANNGIVDEKKLKEVQNMDYEEFKNLLNAKKDFCVYIEDENGNIILSKGSSKLNEDGIPCSE
jgi:hypothetical protein